jgi:hypothetical protein
VGGKGHVVGGCHRMRVASRYHSGQALVGGASVRWWHYLVLLTLEGGWVALIIALVLLMRQCQGAEEGAAQYGGWLGHWEEVVATAYTPSDPVDAAYHATKGERWRWICADGTTDVRRKPYGVAVPLRRGEPAWPFGTRLIIPTGLGYLDRCREDEREFTVDDVGNGVQYFPAEEGRIHLDFRFVDRRDALRWAGPEGKRRLWVFVCQKRIPETIVLIRETNVLMPDTAWPKAEPMPKAAADPVVIEAAFPLTELALPGMITILGIHNRYRRRRSWEPGRR